MPPPVRRCRQFSWIAEPQERTQSQALARKHAGRACASHESPFSDSCAGLARTALGAEAGLGAKGRTGRAVTAAKAFTGRTVTAKTAGAACATRRLAAAVIAEAAVTEATLRRAVTRGGVTEPTLRPACVTEAALRVAFITVTTTLWARVIGAE